MISREEIIKDNLNIIVDDSSFKKILKYRDAAYDFGFIGDKIFVKAQLVCGGKTIKAKIRLKGDHKDPL